MRGTECRGHPEQGTAGELQAFPAVAGTGPTGSKLFPRSGRQRECASEGALLNIMLRVSDQGNGETIPVHGMTVDYHTFVGSRLQQSRSRPRCTVTRLPKSRRQPSIRDFTMPYAPQETLWHVALLPEKRGDLTQISCFRLQRYDKH